MTGVWIGGKTPPTTKAAPITSNHRGLREDETKWRSVFPAHANTGDPNDPIRGLSANQIDCALISMMVGSHDELQSETGYIDARPRLPDRRKPLATHGRTIHVGQNRPTSPWPRTSAFARCRQLSSLVPLLPCGTRTNSRCRTC